MTTSFGDGARTLIRPIALYRRPTAKLPLAEHQNPRYLDKIALTSLLCLDIKATMVMFAQPLGSQLAVMRNFIAILLIVVVPRRIAGDG
ncbi:hypothetical protein HL667_12845 [Bradyrhizobium sp. 83012]|uniref:Uncharacterized protein n=1 Tax=Bradyrhizobium aeschynomenes TaxID=2734909 RepID=A0ABX2CCD5_9BRAD|nr:hypothetical protein [Bradyrhizobium aeschynomenes]NPU09623.1 hypothetical protein [Bradyrhizobium aeschynomenes]NPU65883.1 hypothetical protein [Bradyrhizobium aeschynomenes]NPV20947.1 hypothetical protein [Bradyrhizobium aeschynomenes]